MPKLYRLCGGRPQHKPKFVIPSFDDVRARDSIIENVHFLKQ